MVNAKGAASPQLIHDIGHCVNCASSAPELLLFNDVSNLITVILVDIDACSVLYPDGYLVLSPLPVDFPCRCTEEQVAVLSQNGVIPPNRTNCRENRSFFLTVAILTEKYLEHLQDEHRYCTTPWQWLHLFSSNIDFGTMSPLIIKTESAD